MSSSEIKNRGKFEQLGPPAPCFPAGALPSTPACYEGTALTGTFGIKVVSVALWQRFNSAKSPRGVNMKITREVIQFEENSL